MTYLLSLENISSATDLKAIATYWLTTVSIIPYKRFRLVLEVLSKVYVTSLKTQFRAPDQGHKKSWQRESSN